MLDPNENYPILYIYLCITMWKSWSSWEGKEWIQIYILLYFISKLFFFNKGFLNLNNSYIK
jgi:hypothetical protein